MESDSPFMDEGEAGSYLRISPGTLGNWRRAGHGPKFLKLRGRVVYHRTHLDEWALAQTATPAPPGVAATSAAGVG